MKFQKLHHGVVVEWSVGFGSAVVKHLMLKIFSSIMFDQLLVFLQGEWSDGAAGGTIMT